MIPHRAILCWDLNVYLALMSVIWGLKYIDFGLGEEVGVRLEVKIEACKVFEA